MRMLSAADAIAPAVARTRDLLFRPFHWGTFLKLSVVALFTEGMSGRSNFGNRAGSGAHWNAGPMLFSITPGMIAAIVAIAIAGLIIGVALFYLATRLRFALFECLANQSTEIRPGWHIYRQPANRFFWLSLAVGLGYLLLAAAVLAPFLLGIWHRVQKGGGHPSIAAILELILPMLPILFLLVLLAVAIDIVLRDFMLPHFALDNASAGEALQAVWDRIAAEKGAFFLYALLRIFLPVAAMIALVIALIVPGIILFGGGAVLIAALKAAAVHGSAGVAFGSGLLQVLLLVAMFALGLFLAISFGGPLGIAVRNYALVFYGGRYPELGNMLFPAPAASPGPGLPA